MTNYTFPPLLNWTSEHEDFTRERRIPPAILSTFGVRALPAAWLITTPGGGELVKNLHTGRSKYYWRRADADGVYHAPDVDAAIHDAGGACWLASGPVDVWALRAGWVLNACSVLSGEGRIPSGLVPWLVRHNVRRVMIAPDADATGRRWAGLVREALTAAGIEVIAYDLGGLGKGADIGRLWAGLGADDLAGALEALPLYAWPEPAKPEPVTTTAPPAPWVSDDVHPEYRRLVAAALGVERYNVRGFSVNVSCPFHDDKHPSAALHETRGLHCQVCGWHKWTDTAAALGLPVYRDWLKEHTDNGAGLGSGEPSGLTDAARGLTDAARAELIRRRLTGAARLLDALYLAGWQGGREFTAKEAAAASGLGVQAVYRVLRGGGGDFFSRLSGQGMLQKESTDKSEKKSIGRPVRVYVMPSPGDVMRALGVPCDGVPQGDDDPLPLAPGVRGHAAYRQAVYRRVVAARPGAYSRRRLGKAAGVSGKTTRRYDDPAGVVVVQRVGKGPELCPDDARRLPDERELPAYVWLEDETGRRVPPVRGAALRALGEGRRLWWRWRATNYYDVVAVSPDAVPDPEPPKELRAFLDGVGAARGAGDGVRPVAGAAGITDRPSVSERAPVRRGDVAGAGPGAAYPMTRRRDVAGAVAGGAVSVSVPALVDVAAGTVKPSGAGEGVLPGGMVAAALALGGVVVEVER